MASPHTHAIAASMGSEFNAAAHQANPGIPSGVKRANVKRDEQDWPPAEDDVEGAQECERCEQLQDDEADGWADPVQRSEVGDGAGDEERCGHDVAVVVVEEVRRREEALRAGAADEDEVVPVEVALEGQDRADDELDRDQDDGGRSNPVGAGQPDCHTSFLLVGGSPRLYGGTYPALGASTPAGRSVLTDNAFTTAAATRSSKPLRWTNDRKLALSTWVRRPTARKRPAITTEWPRLWSGAIGELWRR